MYWLLCNFHQASLPGGFVESVFILSILLMRFCILNRLKYCQSTKWHNPQPSSRVGWNYDETINRKHLYSDRAKTQRGLCTPDGAHSRDIGETWWQLSTILRIASGKVVFEQRYVVVWCIVSENNMCFLMHVYCRFVPQANYLPCCLSFVLFGMCKWSDFWSQEHLPGTFRATSGAWYHVWTAPARLILLAGALYVARGWAIN